MSRCRYKAPVERGNTDEFGATIITICHCMSEEDHSGPHYLQVERLAVVTGNDKK